MLKIDIVSGFLGAGKTTFIKRLLETDINNEKIVLIENEFGEISVDSKFLADSQIDIAELSQGCICCSLVGDFAKSLNEVITRFSPDRIIVEPSGVGKLSDVIKAISDAGLTENLNTYVCIVDATKAKLYAKNFKEFFTDQISNAKVVVLSRTDIVDNEKLNNSIEVVRGLNSECNLVTTPISELSNEKLLKVYEGEKSSLLEELLHEEHHHHEECSCGHHHHHDHHEECGCEHHHHHHHHEECGCEHHHHHHHHEDCGCEHHHHHHHHHDEECRCEHHHHHHHDEECGCEHHHHHHHHEDCGCGHHHHHHAEEVFNSVSLETANVYCFDSLQKLLNELAYSKDHGYIVRAKGIVKTTIGWKKFNITPEELLIEDADALAIGCVCVIGVNLDLVEIKNLF